MRRRLQSWLPSEEKLRAHRGLRWLGPLLRRPWLWHLNRRRVAAGAAIGVFFGFLIPLLQIAAAAAVAVLLRANLPVAAAATLVSNPVTYVPIWVAAYRTGAALLGEPVDEAQAMALAAELDAGDGEPGTFADRVFDIGKPLMLGLAIFATGGAALTWTGVNLLWLLAVRLRRRRRNGQARLRDPGEDTPDSR